MSASDDAVPSKAELIEAHCWENDDAVPGRPQMTAFRRRARLHQARWRESKGHPIGSQPIAPKAGAASRPVGSRIPLGYAQRTGANFLNPRAFDAVRHRMLAKEPHQSFDRQRLLADLLWPLAMCFNLFGDFAADLRQGERALRAWWPDTPGSLNRLRFEHSPGWLDPSYLGNLSSFDAAFDLDLGDGHRGILGVEAAYTDAVRPAVPKPERLARYMEIADRSSVFARRAIEDVLGSDLLVIGLDHLLVLSMLQHPSGRWRWARLVVTYPRANRDYADACARYRSLLTDDSTFAAITIEALLDSGALPPSTAGAFRTRYLPP